MSKSLSIYFHLSQAILLSGNHLSYTLLLFYLLKNKKLKTKCWKSQKKYAEKARNIITTQNNSFLFQYMIGDGKAEFSAVITPVFSILQK